MAEGGGPHWGRGKHITTLTASYCRLITEKDVENVARMHWALISYNRVSDWLWLRGEEPLPPNERKSTQLSYLASKPYCFGGGPPSKYTTLA